MIEVSDNTVIFSFPQVDERAILRVHFVAAAKPEEVVRINEPIEGAYRLGVQGPVALHLRPNVLWKNPGYPTGLRYPFALLVSVGGKNALTGYFSSALVRCPQNYFASPPQGGIDGYFAAGRVFPFRAVSELPLEKARLEIKVYPMKKEALDFYTGRLGLCGGPDPHMRGFTLLHGGERKCEPVYEELCCIGDWEQGQEERVSFWVASEGQNQNR